jgi:hypothetical protein
MGERAGCKKLTLGMNSPVSPSSTSPYVDALMARRRRFSRLLVLRKVGRLKEAALDILKLFAFSSFFKLASGP